MRNPYTIVPSRLLPGEGEYLRRHAFTRGMSLDLLQAATEFLRNLRLLPVYAECSGDNLHRYLLWSPPEGCGIEVRSGRTQEQFEAFDLANIDRGWVLVSLHLNEKSLYSAVWISSDHAKAAIRFLESYGITPASRLLKT
jgi:hypothetical protein